MKTDGLFTTHSFTIKVRSGVPFHLVFFGDVHRDSPSFADGAWRDFLGYAKGLKEAYFIGMGDYLDSTSTSERKCLASSDFHETTVNDLQELAAQKVKLLSKELSFMKGRIIGLINGNHYFSFSDGTNSDNKLCAELDCKYLGVSSFVRLTIKPAGASNSRCLDLWLHHGSGGSGRLLGGSINKIDQMREHAEADIYALGHDHKRGVVPATPRLYLDNSSRAGLRVCERQQWLCRTGSFLASYTPGTRNYNVDVGRGPCSLGHVELIVTPKISEGYITWDMRGLA